MEAFTVVMPVHNEEKFLPLSLPSIYNLNPSEVILIFDRCTDRSLEVTKECSSRHRFCENTKFVEVTEEVCRRVLSLPVHPLVDRKAIKYVLDVLKDISSSR